MENPRIAARPVAESALVHPDVDRAFISRLVRAFYDRVRSDSRLGPIFAREITGNWEPHLEKMTDFWSSVILKTGGYHGRPVPAHMKIEGITPEDFGIWLALFRSTAEELCTPEVAAIFIERAERIARSLQLALFFHLPAHKDALVRRERTGAEDA